MSPSHSHALLSISQVALDKGLNFNLDHLVKVMSTKFFYCKVTSFPFPYSILWKAVLKCSLHSRKQS